MNIRLSKLKYTAIILAGFSATFMSAMANADWSFIGLGTMGRLNSEAYGINDSGQVVGFSYTAAEHAFITGPNGVGMTDVGSILGGSGWSAALDINDSGQLTGWSTTADGSFHAFITGSNGTSLTDLGTLGGKGSHPYSINGSGQVVGYSNTANNDTHAFITGPNGVGMTDLSVLLGEQFISVTAINDSEQVAGVFSTNGLSREHVFIAGSNGGGMTDLGTLNVFGGFSYFNEVTDINNSGQIVGSSSGVYDADNSSTYGHAFVTGTDGENMVDLGTLGGSVSRANAINDSGEVVGHAGSTGFLFSHGGMIDLSLLAPVVASGWNFIPTDINNNGQIVGYGYKFEYINGEYTLLDQAFLLSYTPDTIFTPNPIFIPPPPPPAPIPEPKIYAMLLAGLGLIGFMARCRKEVSV